MIKVIKSIYLYHIVTKGLNIIYTLTPPTRQPQAARRASPGGLRPACGASGVSDVERSGDSSHFCRLPPLSFILLTAPIISSPSITSPTLRPPFRVLRTPRGADGTGRA